MSNQVISKSIIKLLGKKKLTLSVAESVTAGALAAELTSIAGASKVFVGGVIAYSDQVKISELKVKKNDLSKHTAVSEQVAIAMAIGARERFNTDIAISTTGVAGPGRAYGQKAGTAWVGVASKKSALPLLYPLLAIEKRSATRLLPVHWHP